jgi:predicted HTH domain antitoxin
MILLFQQDKISLGKASELLRMSQIRFQRLLADRGICVHYGLNSRKIYSISRRRACLERSR